MAKINITFPKPEVRGVAVIVRKADIDKYGREEARRRAYEAAGVQYEIPSGDNE